MIMEKNDIKPSTLLKLMLLADLIIEAEMEAGIYGIESEAKIVSGTDDNEPGLN